MKILIDGRMYGLENTGIGRYIVKLVEELSQQKTDHEFIILLRPKYAKTLNLPKNWAIVNCDIHHYSFNEQTKLLKVLNSINADITHFPHFNVPILYTKPYIVTIHDLLMHKQKGLEATTLSPLSYYTKRLAYKTIFGVAVAKAKKIIVPSNFVKFDLIKNYPRLNSTKISAIYEGSTMSSLEISFKSRSTSQIPYLLYVGNAYPHKNLELLIKSIDKINENTPNTLRLLIVSARNVFTKRLEEKIIKLKAEEFVEVMNFLPDSELAQLYKNSSGFIYPSLHEGFGLPGLEAMASNTPVLCSNIPVFKEVYKNHAIYFNPKKSSSIINSINKLLSMSPAAKKSHTSKAKKFAATYSWKKMSEETLKMYETAF